MNNSDTNIKLFNKNYFLLWQGQFMSRIGSQVYLIAMIIWIKEATDSASLLGLMGFIGGIPAVIFSIIGGVFADRHSRKKIIVFTDIINGVLMLALALLFYTTQETPSIIVVSLMVITLINSITGSYFIPAISASIPDIVHKDKLTSANSWSQGSQQIVSIFGLGLGGLLYTLLGAPLLVLINGISFIFSAASESFITIPQVIPEKKKLVKEQFENFIKDIKIGFGYIWERSGLKQLVLTSVLVNFFSVPIALLLPFYVDNVMQLNDSWLGYLLATSATGSLVGFLISGILKLSPKVRMFYIVLFIFLDGLFYVLLGVFSSVIPVLLILFTSGFLAGFVQVHIQTILQITTESKMRGRIFGFIGTISGALIPIGMGLAGFIADLTNKNIPIIYMGAGLFVMLISIYIIRSRDIKDFLAIDYSSKENSISLEKEKVERDPLVNDKKFGKMYKKEISKINGSISYLNISMMEKLKKILKSKTK